jgi:hypothetical protein
MQYAEQQLYCDTCTDWADVSIQRSAADRVSKDASMGKEEVEAAIDALEAWGRTIDLWVMICAIGVAIFLSGEVFFSVAHWLNDRNLVPLRAEQSRLHEVELAQLGAAAANAAKETARLSVEAETAKGAIASANARAAEAELRIRKLEPRNLNWAAFVDALLAAPRSKVEVLYFADDFDSMALAQQIALAIKAAGWEEPYRGPIKRPPDWSESTPMAVDGQPTGVTVVARLGPERESVSSGNILPADSEPATSFTAMRRAIMFGTGRVATWTNGPHAPPYGTIRIVVAPRE